MKGQCPRNILWFPEGRSSSPAPQLPLRSLIYALESLGKLGTNAKYGRKNRRMDRRIPSRKLPIFLLHIRLCDEDTGITDSDINATERFERVG